VRAGPGSHRRPLVGKPFATTCDLFERLERIPSGPLGRQRRVVTAMAAYGAPHEEIACVLAIGEEHLRDSFAEDLAIGALLTECNALHAIWKSARADTWQAIKYPLCRMERPP
jgi:hypothetical protein